MMVPGEESPRMLVRLLEPPAPDAAAQVAAAAERLGRRSWRVPAGLVVDGDGADLAAALSHLPGVVSVEPLGPAHPLVARAVEPGGRRVAVGPVVVGGAEFVVVAGPCAVESQAQVREAAWAVAASGARVLRAGAFKPRTSPHAFQGLGREALEMLSRVRDEVGLPVVTEVLAPEDVPLVSAHADMLQVGARNMQNVALLRALGRGQRPVLLKRGTAATLDELLMAAEHIVANGNPHVVLCERGVRSFDGATRNMVDLAGVAVLKRATHLPVLVDPSHGTGRADLVAAVSCAATAVGADGLLVEVHPRPDEALSDGAQSLTPAAFESLMRELSTWATLVGRRLAVSGDRVSAQTRLDRARARIDRLDEAIASLLDARARLSAGAAGGEPALDLAAVERILSK
jgi:3-deoxy-7-phosphoheptulonate synthase